MRKKRPPEHANHERWLVSYADFITLLFAFFTTMYAISTVDQKKAGKLQYSMMTAFNVEFFPGSQAATGHAVLGSPTPTSSVPVGILGGTGMSRERRKPRPPGEAIGDLVSNLDHLAAKFALGERVTVRREARGVIISLAEAGFFDSGSAALRQDGHEVIELIAFVLEEQRDEFSFQIEGHTDDVPVRGGRFTSNWELSTARATEVLSLFVARQRLEPAYLSAAGYAEFRPVAANTTPDGRRKNRRVDIVATPRSAEPSNDPLLPATPTATSTAAIGEG
ncbi:OmpA family protein [Myxococcota bacterium]|nr:OmpA family protein [Myxococcota bacterium]